MTAAIPEGRPDDPKVMAAIMAAVEAYLYEADRLAPAGGSPKLNAWKSAPWSVLRGGLPPIASNARASSKALTITT